MSRKQLVDMTHRHIAHAKARTVDQAPDIFSVPAKNYFDPDRWKLEMDRIFKRIPLTMAFSCELKEPGSYRAMEAAGVPVLITRAADGQVRAFVNSCSHRGAVIVPEGTGKARRFTCPYHAWSYDQKGALAGILDNDEFGDLDKSCHGLTPLPAAERAGIIFVILNPDSTVDFDQFLCGYDEMLGHFEFDKCVMVGRQAIEGPNWKVAYDGYLDFYHLPILHRDSFGPDMPNKAVYDAWGPHQRVSIPMPGMEAMLDSPEEDWPLRMMLLGVWTIFPHISITSFEPEGKMWMISQLFPGSTPDTSVTVQNFLFPEEPTDEQREAIEEQINFLRGVVEDEDYYTGNRIQRALKTGAKSEVLFGKNEGGGQRFHSWVQALIEADDEDLASVFASKIGPEVK